MGSPRLIRVGVIGAGQIAQHHLETYAKIPGAQVVALVDRDKDAARTTAERFSIPKVEADIKSLLARDDIDSVDVCLHNNLHRSVTEAALASGKHVYCEKPMAGSYADAAAMLACARSHGRNLHIQLYDLYTEETRAARELIAAGELGTLYHARSVGFRRRGRAYVDGYGSQSFVQRRISGGGALYDVGVYHISQVLHLLGNPAIDRISGVTCQAMPMDEDRRRASGFDVEEFACGLVRCAGGLSIDIVEAWSGHLDRMEGSVIMGSHGGLRLAPFGFFRSYGDLDVSGSIDIEATRNRWNLMRDREALEGESQQHWISALQGRIPLFKTAEVALSTMLVSEGIYRSQAAGHEVTAEEVIRSSVSTALPF